MSGNATLLIVAMIPFLVAALAAAVTRRPALTALAGLLLVPAVVFAIGYASADSTQGSCSDCGEYGGRYWEPWVIGFFALVGSLAWGIGAAVGRALPFAGKGA
jgi:hypothetical protein